MNAEAELAKALVASVGEIAVAAHRLHAVLKDEHQVLATGDDAALLALTGVKTELLQQLEALENERMHLVGELRTGSRHAPFAMQRALTPWPAALTAWERSPADLRKRERPRRAASGPNSGWSTTVCRPSGGLDGCGKDRGADPSREGSGG